MTSATCMVCNRVVCECSPGVTALSRFLGLPLEVTATNTANPAAPPADPRDAEIASLRADLDTARAERDAARRCPDCKNGLIYGGPDGEADDCPTCAGSSSAAKALEVQKAEVARLIDAGIDAERRAEAERDCQGKRCGACVECMRREHGEALLANDAAQAEVERLRAERPTGAPTAHLATLKESLMAVREECRESVPARTAWNLAARVVTHAESVEAVANDALARASRSAKTRNAAEADAAALRAAIEQAPHHPACVTISGIGGWHTKPCDCWKARALAAAPASATPAPTDPRPLCSHDAFADVCPTCAAWACAVCKRTMPPDKGAADDMPDSCDDCWKKAHATAAAPKEGT